MGDPRVLAVRHWPEARDSVCASDWYAQKQRTAFHKLWPLRTEQPHDKMHS